MHFRPPLSRHVQIDTYHITKQIDKSNRVRCPTFAEDVFQKSICDCTRYIQEIFSRFEFIYLLIANESPYSFFTQQDLTKYALLY